MQTGSKVDNRLEWLKSLLSFSLELPKMVDRYSSGRHMHSWMDLGNRMLYSICMYEECYLAKGKDRRPDLFHY